jgi:hypothetical protein
MAVMLLVFTVDVAVAGTCCPLDMDMGTSLGTDAAPVNSTMPAGENCPQSDDASGDMGHDACCLACVVMLPAWQFPEIDSAAQSFSSPLTYINPSSGFEPPYRPPITHLS